MRLAAALLLVAAALAAADWTAAGKAWWKHVEYLASDKLEGRNVGSPGYDQAAAYVRAQFEKAGLNAPGIPRPSMPRDRMLALCRPFSQQRRHPAPPPVYGE